MLEVKETTNYLKITYKDCDEESIDEIQTVLDDMNISINDIRSCEISIWKDVSYDSDGTYRHHKDIKTDSLTNDWTMLLEGALIESKDLTKPQVDIRLLFKKPDPMKAVVDNLNLNLGALHDKLKDEL